MTLPSPSLASPWAALMLTAAWQGGAALLLAGLVTRLWRSLSPTARCWVWRIAYLKILALILWTAPLHLPLLRADAPPAPPPQPVVIPRPAMSVTPAPHLAPPAPPPHPFPWLSLLFLGWGAGALLAMARLGRECLSALRLRRGCKPVNDPLLLSLAHRLAQRFGLSAAPPLLAGNDIPGPLLVGLLRPAILLPSWLLHAPRSQLETALAHELAHLRRHDLLWNLLPALAGIPFFFHPLHWIAHREFRLSQELACDHLALSATRCDPAQYAHALIDVAQRSLTPVPALASGIFASRRSLHRRILAMKELRHSTRRRSITIAALLLAIGLLAIPPWRVVAQDAKPTDAPKTDSHEPEANDIARRLRERRQTERAPQRDSFIGLLVAQRLTLAPAADGTLAKVEVRSGDRVKSGQVLLVLDDLRAKLALEQAQAQLQVATATLQRAQTGRDESEIKIAEARVAGAKVEMDLRRQDLADTRITAPFDGTVQVHAVVGQRVRAGDALGELVEQGKLKAAFRIPESRLRAIKIGQKLELRAYSFQDQPFLGTISAIAPSVDSSSGTIAVEAEIPHPIEGLLPGMGVVVQLPPPTKPQDK